MQTPQQPKDYRSLSAAEQKAVDNKARALVDSYNAVATKLAGVLMDLYGLLRQYGEPVGAGAIVESGDGWKGNALEVIPALTMAGVPFKNINRPGVLLDASPQSQKVLFDAPEFAEAGLDPRSPEAIAHKGARARQLQADAAERGEHLSFGEAVMRVYRVSE
jgi:hypothetical protein